MIIQLRIRYDSRDASYIRFDWIYTNWYEILELVQIQLRTRLIAFEFFMTYSNKVGLFREHCVKIEKANGQSVCTHWHLLRID